MIGASPLPLPQATTFPGFAAFLATIGQASTVGEAGGFDQLLAAAPVNGFATMTIEAAPAAAEPVATATPVAVVAPAAITLPAAAPVAETDMAKPSVAGEAPVAKGKADEARVDTDAVVASAEKLLIAVKGRAPAAPPAALDGIKPDAESRQIGVASPEPTTGKAVEVETKVEVDVPADIKTDDAHPVASETQAAVPSADQAGPADPATSWIPVVAAAPLATSVVGKSAKVNEAVVLSTENAVVADETAPAATLASQPRNLAHKPAAPTRDAAPIAVMADKPRVAAQPIPAAAIARAEPAAAKPAEAVPSMTVLFAQPANAGAAMPIEAVRPIAAAELVLDMSSDGAWIDQLAHDIAATKSESGDISFRLMPRHLGRLDVAMRQGDEGVALKMDTQHEATATIVTAAQGRLVDELRQQGVRVAGSEVTCTPGETGRQSQGQNDQGQGRAAAPDPAQLIETATERAKPRDKEEAANRRGRFA